MLDQSFSVKNIRRIFEIENRKGVYVEGKYFPVTSDIASKIKLLNSSIKKLYSLRAVYGKERFYKLLTRLKSSRSKLLDRKRAVLEKEFETVANDIVKKNYEVKLNIGQIVSGKPTYSYADTRENFFALKQVQRNIRKSYGVKQRNRHDIVCQLQTVLADNFPKQIIKLDLANFYEAIPQHLLLRKINSDGLLTRTSIKMIHSVLGQYKNLSSSDKGLPRGIGISAYLSELYMRKFDKHVMLDPNIYYYARYVDDIVVVYARNEKLDVNGKMLKLVEYLGEMQLSINSEKTEIIDNMSNFKIEYLGYEFKVNGGNLSTKISHKKINRYKKRLDASFLDYRKQSGSHREKGARKLLVNRIKYLTGNTRLANNKKNVFVGIYFSNDRMTDMSVVNGLDHYLAHLISKLQNPKLETKLSSYSYVKGFKERTFHIFSAHDLTGIVKAWAYEA